MKNAPSLLLAFVMAITGVARGATRERLSLDFNWKFHLGDDFGVGEVLDKGGQSSGPARLNFDDFAWRAVDLPHDWAIELPFDGKANHDHGYKPLGSPYTSNSIGWYRRVFTLPEADKGRRIWLEFDGVYRDCRVFVNGFRVAHEESGYNSFRCDITDVANCGGRNVVAVRVDASEFEGWFYEGAGIYRHVWLVKTDPLAVAPDGVFVYSAFPNNEPVGAATVHFETVINNAQSKSADAKVRWQILDAAGKEVANTDTADSVAPWASTELKGVADVVAPELWSPESPMLYKLVTTVESGGATVDRVETEFGIRTVAFDTTNGFLLNGKRCVIKGVCNHQDHAGVGAALPDALQYFRAAKLKGMGCNAVRTSHNEPTAEWLEACDHLGLLVMDETRRLGSDPDNLANVEQQIRRDRSHPSVFIWSLSNEEWLQREPVGARVIDTMQRLTHRLDPTRLCTAAMNSWSGEKPDGFSTTLDVQGFNYLNNGGMDAFHKNNPDKPCIGTEEASAFYTRGVYKNTEHYKSAYDDNKPGYGATAEEWWKYYSARPWATGSFAWTGFDYRGEESPFQWPNINSEFGIIDVCGFPKDVFYYYQAWWGNRPMLHLMPHWTWPGKEGKDIDVRCFSNCEEVELFRNGKSIGRKRMEKNSHLQWSVAYEPGTLSAKGYNGGAVAAEEAITTAGAPAALNLAPDRTSLHADGEDASVITVEIKDAEGRFAPVATNLVRFELTGPGRIIGVGNGDPLCHEPDVFVSQPAARDVTLDRWRMKKVPDLEKRPEIRTDFDDSDWQAVDTRRPFGPLQADEKAVYRTDFTLTDKDAAAEGVYLRFGMIDDEGWVYVNGQFAGESHDWQTSPHFDLKKLAHPGRNTIAVLVKNNENSGGINRGVALEIEGKPAMAAWSRSAFNGLAQVIVRADRSAGEIHLTAKADGLAPAEMVFHANDDQAWPVAP